MQLLASEPEGGKNIQFVSRYARDAINVLLGRSDGHIKINDKEQFTLMREYLRLVDERFGDEEWFDDNDDVKLARYLKDGVIYSTKDNARE